MTRPFIPPRAVDPLREENERLTARNAELENAVKWAKRIVDEALPKFDWGRSALDANAIAVLNVGVIEIKKVSP